jgi:hypothetical protein
MTNEAQAFDEDVAEIVGKLEGLPLFRRRDKSAASLALMLLSARFASEEDGTKSDFVESAGDAWDLEVDGKVAEAG